MHTREPNARHDARGPTYDCLYKSRGSLWDSVGCRSASESQSAAIAFAISCGTQQGLTRVLSEFSRANAFIFYISSLTNIWERNGLAASVPR